MAFTIDTSARLPTDTTVGGRTTNPGGMTYRCGANAKLLVLGIATGAGPAPGRTEGTPTFGGKLMTQICTSAGVSGTAEVITEMWQLLSPSTGLDASILVPNAGGSVLLLWASSWNVSSGYSVVFDGSIKVSQTVTNPTVNVISSDANELVLQIMGDGLVNITSFAVSPGNYLSGTSPLDKGAYQVEMQWYIKPLKADISVGFTANSSPTGMVTGWWKQQLIPRDWGGILKFWNGTSWTECPSSKFKFYNGAAMTICPSNNLKIWGGNSWWPIRRQGY